MVAQVQVLTLDRTVEWSGDLDELIQGNAELSQIEQRWLETLEIGGEVRVGGSEGPFLVRRVA